MTSHPLPPDKTDPASAGHPSRTSAADGQAVERLRHKLLGRIAEASTPRHLTIHAGPEGWEPFVDGVECKVLREDAGTLSYLLRFAPGAVLPGHRHPQDEECLVLEGALKIGELTVGAGSYHLAHADVLHADICAPAGATIFLRGACPEVSHGI